MKSFPHVEAGEWVQPKRKGYKLACCDCGLVHRMEFRLVKYGPNLRKIQFRAWRDNRATALSASSDEGGRMSVLGRLRDHADTGLALEPEEVVALLNVVDDLQEARGALHNPSYMAATKIREARRCVSNAFAALEESRASAVS